MEKTKEELDSIFKELLKHETEFCEENEYQKNEHGSYIYVSSNGNSSIRLDMVLNSYKQWLIETNIVKEKY